MGNPIRVYKLTSSGEIISTYCQQFALNFMIKDGWTTNESGEQEEASEEPAKEEHICKCGKKYEHKMHLARHAKNCTGA